MLENIALIASFISAVTALTTSLRAVGVSREYERGELEDKLRSSCRSAGQPARQKPSRRSSLRLHLFVTIIWYALAMLFALPMYIQKTSGAQANDLMPWILPFLLLAAVLIFIWRSIVKHRSLH